MSITKPLPKVNGSEQSIMREEHLIPIQIPERRIKPIIYEEPTKLKVKKKKHSRIDVELSELERNIIKRLKKKKKKIIKIEEEKPNKYVGFSNRLFGEISRNLSKKELFDTLKRDLIKANMKFVPASYISLMLMTTLLSISVGLILFVFFLFFNLGSSSPFITKMTEEIGTRLLKTFWIIIATPIVTFLSIYFYPSVEKAYLENKINQELPFASIHMAAISAALIEPSKMFKIIVSTGDYPFIEKEFIKIINEINVYGYDFVTALRNTAYNSPSQRLAELLNGIATTVNSGGDLSNFFEKRSQSLLFEYRVEREKYTRTAETFMDIYISLVIAAPMIFMLMLIMMQVSGLGISLGKSAITLIMLLGVSMINILFLTFLQLKQPGS